MKDILKIIPQNNFVRFALVTIVILLAPFIAMQFTNEVSWNVTDFVVMGALIFGTGLVYELITQKLGKERRLIIGITLAVLFLWIWAELAVGVFTNWGS